MSVAITAVVMGLLFSSHPATRPHQIELAAEELIPLISQEEALYQEEQHADAGVGPRSSNELATPGLW